MTAIIRKLTPEQGNGINWNNRVEIKRDVVGLQTQELITKLKRGESVVVIDYPGEPGRAHSLAKTALDTFGSTRVDIVPLNDEDAARLEITGVSAFAVRLRPLELNEI